MTRTGAVHAWKRLPGTREKTVLPADRVRRDEPRLLVALRAATGQLNRGSLAIQRRQQLLAREEIDVVDIRQLAAADECLPEAQHGPPHHRPAERQLGDMLLADRNQALRIAEQLLERSQAPRRARECGECSRFGRVAGRDDLRVTALVVPSALRHDDWIPPVE
jgi:hypothetical protein